VTCALSFKSTNVYANVIITLNCSPEILSDVLDINIIVLVDLATTSEINAFPNCAYSK